MKHSTLLIRALLSIFPVLTACLCFQSPLMAQVKKQVTPGTFSSKSRQATPAAIGSGLQQFYSSTGHYTISADGIGSTNSSMNIRVNKPNAQATVEKAILISAVTESTIDNGCVTLSGVPITWDGSASITYFNNYWADVTSIVASTINAFPAGISTLPITECNTFSTDGEALLVVFNDPSATEKTVIVMLGAQDSQGDNFSVTLAKPIDPSASGALLDMGLGIGFSYQLNATNQASQVSINGQRISSSAGGEDDGTSTNGALLTVGGIGDLDDNPADPFALPVDARSDDELYSVLPFINNTTTNLTVSTLNPSLDDNIFLAYFVTSGAAIIGEGILLSQTGDTGNVGSDHTVKATVVNSLGQPVVGRQVTFTITSGPNAGKTFSALTDASGNASYTYTGTGGPGTDNIQACFTNSENATSCSNTLSFTWVQANQNTAPYFINPPTPADGTEYDVMPGQPINFTVEAQDNDSADVVMLSATGIPSGAISTPSLPTNGNPVSDAFSWTPGSSDVGTYTIQYKADDGNGGTATTNVIISVSSGCDCDTSFQTHIGVIPKYTVKGQDYHTIYKGYGLQSVALLAAHHGGTAPYTYQWTDGNKNHLRVVSPDVTTTYCVTITDAHGCKSTSSVTIYVVDVRCSSTVGNIYVCKDGETMSVAKADVQKWLDQGAKLGQCNMPVPVVKGSSAKMAGDITSLTAKVSAFTSYPNPAKSVITFASSASINGNAKLVITDMQGRILMTQAFSGTTQRVDVSRLMSGVYMAKLVTDKGTEATSRFVVSK